MTTSFKPPSKALSPREAMLLALAGLAFLILSAALVYGNLVFGRSMGGGGEFYLPWVGGRAFLFERIEPYSANVPASVQELVYGRAAKAGEEPYILDIPFHLLLLFFPFALLPDPELARAVFLLILEAALFLFSFFSLRIMDLKSPPLIKILFIVFCVLNYYSFQGLLETTPVFLLCLACVGIVLALQNGQDEFAGALIVLSCFYWEVGGPFLLLIISRVFQERRQRVLAGFGMMLLVLAAASFLWYPDWIIPFLRATVNNLRADFGFSSLVILGHIWPETGRWIAWMFSALLVLALGYEWSGVRTTNHRRFLWAICLTLAVTPLLGFRTEMENLVVLILPLAFVFMITYERWPRFGHGLTILIFLLVLCGPWAVYFFVLPRYGKMAKELLFLFYPVFTVAGLYWIRWWALRPPRTWLERASRMS